MIDAQRTRGSASLPPESYEVRWHLLVKNQAGLYLATRTLRIQWSANWECFISGSTGMWHETQSFLETRHGLPMADLPAWHDRHLGS